MHGHVGRSEGGPQVVSAGGEEICIVVGLVARRVVRSAFQPTGPTIGE
jgi:hypothetical protein